MEKLSYENSQRAWIEYMVWQIFCKYAYPSLEPIPPISYPEYMKPEFNGDNREMPITYKGKQYFELCRNV